MTEGGLHDPNEICFTGCSCRVCTCSADCSCMRFGKNYLKEEFAGKKLLCNIDKHIAGESTPPIYECSVVCKCGSGCENRLIQNGVTIPLLVYACGDSRGLGVRTLTALDCGEFVCEYAGEVLSVDEAKKRASQQTIFDKNYILALREHTDMCAYVTIIDPTHTGNVGRFINHSCDPNLIMIPVRVECDIPRLALFARRSVSLNEELTFDYGGQQQHCKPTNLESLKKCLCKSANCLGYLPYDDSVY